MEIKDQIIGLLKTMGPSVTNDLVKKLDLDSIFISSYLGDLKREGRILITNLKFGSSPYYYLPEHGERVDALSKHLNEKDMRTYQLLKSNKVLRTSEQTPLVRVSLENIPDFAVPMKINFRGKAEIFYRFFLVTQDMAVKIIKEKYFQIQTTSQVKSTSVKKDLSSKRSNKSSNKTNKSDLENKQSDSGADNVSDSQGMDKSINVKIENKNTLSGVKNPNAMYSKSSLTEGEDFKPDMNEGSQSTLNFIEESDDKLIIAVRKKFKELKIEIISVQTIRKNSESDFIIKINSPIGLLDYFCKTKFKKKINDGDLSTAYISGQSKSLPVLFVTNGKLTKKAKEISEKEFKNNFKVLEI